ncbi:MULTISPECIES: zinc metalloprotease HtpX [unclassified Roseitalea]|uniref:zinc metalloprotease HtpX n=1 Tax=unclassified Roseitalea TaxID=2639107 RepID=UPI0027402932|nr:MULTISPECIES: zinc metalloprotease HtpX [unclassified Roseitalea]
MAFAFFEHGHAIHRRHRTINRLHTWLLVGGSLALLAVTAWAIAGTIGIVYALVFGVISLLAARNVSPDMVLRMYKAQPVSPVNFPAGYRLIQELARRASLDHPPRLYVVPSRMMNAFAVGRPDRSAIAVTDQLVRHMTMRELAGVLAHEVTHIRNDDLKVMSLADVVSRLTSTLSTVGIIAIVFNLTGFFPTVPWLGILAMIAAPTIGSLLQLALSRTREFDADYGAAMLTGDPDGLAAALQKLEHAHRRRLEAMMLPTGRMAEPSMLRSHPRTEERVERLLALKQSMLPGPAGPVGVAEGRHIPIRRPGGSVPTVRPRWRRDGRADRDWFDFARSRPHVAPVIEGEEADCPGCAESLHAPADDAPRIRFARGGVWW